MPKRSSMTAKLCWLPHICEVWGYANERNAFACILYFGKVAFMQQVGEHCSERTT